MEDYRFQSRTSIILPINGSRKSALLALVFLTWSAEAIAQGCCTAGASSLGGFESAIQPYKTLALSANYQYNSLTETYQDRNNIEDPLKRTAEVAYFTFQLEYGLQPRLSILASLYYSDKNRELTVQSGQGTGVFTEAAKFRGSGIGDLIILGKYQLIPSTLTLPFGLALGGGASLPTGSFTDEQNGSQLSIDLQPGTGGTTLIVWGLATYSLPEDGLHFFLTGTYRYAASNLNGYRIGDEILVNVGGEKSLGENFSALLLLRSRFAQKDFATGRFLIGTGGTYYDVMPALSYLEGPSTARIFGQLPVYRNVRGIQLTVTYLLGVEYRYTFDFRDIVDVIVPEI